MIKVDFNGVECKGSKIMLIADVTTIMHHLLDEKIVTADELIDAVGLAQKSEEEVAKEVDDLMEKSQNIGFLICFSMFFPTM